MISETPHIFDCPICGMVWSVAAQFSPRDDDGVIHVHPVVTQLCDCEGEDDG